jgi:hypothetical protein
MNDEFKTLKEVFAEEIDEKFIKEREELVKNFAHATIADEIKELRKTIELQAHEIEMLKKDVRRLKTRTGSY